ncbi:MAG: hypothetical protein JJT76_11370 [Clostridiaceae bacterium]|nr:hypothetical protein [Clostridiaceae bacterium]
MATTIDANLIMPNMFCGPNSVSRMNDCGEKVVDPKGVMLWAVGVQ